MFRILAVLALSAGLAVAQEITLTDAQALAIGKRIWKNESGGLVTGLTAWNKGEDFASLGIGHFIWYPEGRSGPFQESFPQLMRFLQRHNVKVPEWMLGACPWPTRAAFMANFEGPRLVQLRALLADTIGLQARFCANRLERALPKMLEAAPKDQRERIRRNFYRVARQPLGMYALVDYVNFKGEGTNPTERYKGQGWGLLQVLELMPDQGPAMADFSKAANRVLTRRVENSPPARNEAQWLPGWRNRVATYAS